MSSVSIDKVIFPIDKIHATLKVHGIYAIPDEWKSTDDANPGLFTYTVRMAKFQIGKGKICPRELTDKQKRQIEEKSKKGGKKQSKNPQPNQQQQRIRKIEQQKQRQRQQLFSKLSQQQQFYYNSQDIYRSPYLRFEQITKGDNVFQGNNCLIFEQRLLKDKGDWIYLYKMPIVSQDELLKMRKSKPKTLGNINDLNPVVMRAWVNLQQFAAGAVEVRELRCRIQQVDKTPQTPQPNLQHTYIKLTLSLQEPIIQHADQYSTSSLISDPQQPLQKLPQQRALDQLKQQIGLAVQSLAMQFSTMFWKDLNLQQDQRLTQVFLTNKKGQLSKRKQHFLYDFNVTGKYKILKDRIKKCIVHLCQSKYNQFFIGMKSFNGIKCNTQDQIYSEIYNLLVETYQQKIFNIIHEKEQQLGEVLVLNNQTIRLEREGILNQYKEETVVDRAKRVMKEYELVLDYAYGEQALRKYISQYPQVIQLKYLYGTYCLKYNLKPVKQLLPFILQYLTKQKFTLTEDKKIQFMLILLNSGGDSFVSGWIILREIIENQIKQSGVGDKMGLCRWLVLASVVLKGIGRNGLAEKYRAFALREFKKTAGGNEFKGHSDHNQSPYKSQIPSLTAVASYEQTSTLQDLAHLYENLIEYLGQFSCFDLIKKIIEQKSKLINEKKQGEIISLQEVLPQINILFVSNINDATSRNRLVQMTLSLYMQHSSLPNSNQKSKILQLLIKSYLFRLNFTKTTQDIKSLQLYLKKSLTTNNNDPFNKYITLLRMGYVYFLKEEYGNSRACLLKYLQKAVDYPGYLSGLSYKLLGIASLKLQRTNQAIQCFKNWNMCDIENRCVWLYLALAFAKSKQPIVVNQCLSQYKRRCVYTAISTEQNCVLLEISAIIRDLDGNGQYEAVLKEKILDVVRV